MANPAGKVMPEAYLLDQVAQRWHCRLTDVKAAPHEDVLETLAVMDVESKAARQRKLLGR